MRNAIFEVVPAETSAEVLVIRDIGPHDLHKTVTNDAEAVVAHLWACRALPAGRRLLYYDSDGNLDEILVVNGKFAGFKVGSR